MTITNEPEDTRPDEGEGIDANEDIDDDNRGNRAEAESVESALGLSSLTDHPYQVLTPDVVIDAVESTGRLSDACILALNSYENRVYQVGIEESEPVIVKFYRPNRWSVEQILEEHEFTQQLCDLEIPVVPPLIINEQSDTPTLARFNDFYFAIYPRQGGRAPELDNLDHLYRLGQAIGRIHAAGAAFPFKYRVPFTVQAFGNDNVAYLLENNFIPADLVPAYQSIAAEVLAEIERNHPESKQHKQISLHGDCHPGNVLWRNDSPHFVDFDDAMTGPAIQDLWMLLSGDRINRQKQLSEIIEGYDMFHSFDVRELKLIESLRAMRVLNYSAWLAKRWDDPAFPQSFPWFNTPRYWSEHVLELKELLSALQEKPLTMIDS
ncbi:MAG: Ser/Thr protein kinase RdoA (MazF antagonist) [Urechidicola sp.]|jgi:Ser/Thr protein kinase RdoA (MazF antagonist)